MNSRLHTISSSLRQSMLSMLGIEKLPHDPDAVGRIREAMLDELGSVPTRQRALLALRIHRTDDATGLWFARAELYAHLCQVHSEPVALERIQALTPLFEGWIPRSLMNGYRPTQARSPARTQTGTSGASPGAEPPGAAPPTATETPGEPPKG